MRNDECGCLLAVVISLFVGVILGVVYFFELLPITEILVLGFPILAVVTLITLIFIATFGGNRIARCICGNGNCLLAGIIGTIVTGAIALAIDVTLVSTATAIIVGIFGLFATLFIIALTVLVNCIIDANCRCRE